jgi:hypothetical protein
MPCRLSCGINRSSGTSRRSSEKQGHRSENQLQPVQLAALIFFGKPGENGAGA